MERRNEEKFDQTIQQQIEEKEIQIDFIEQYAQPDFPEESWNANTQWMQILSIPERLVCLMAFANQVFPKVWDTFFTVAGGRVGKGLSPQTSHRTVRDSLPSHGSCHTIIIFDKLYIPSFCLSVTILQIVLASSFNRLKLCLNLCKYDQSPSLHTYYRYFNITMALSDS